MKFKCKYCGNIIRQDSEAPVEWCPYCHSRLIFNGTNEEGENIYRENRESVRIAENMLHLPSMQTKWFAPIVIDLFGTKKRGRVL